MPCPGRPCVPARQVEVVGKLVRVRMRVSVLDVTLEDGTGRITAKRWESGSALPPLLFAPGCLHP